MQEGDDSVNQTIYIPFSTMSDFKDTHYLDGSGSPTKATDYRAGRAAGARVTGPAYNFKPDDNARIVSNLMKQLKQFQIITWD